MNRAFIALTLATLKKIPVEIFRLVFLCGRVLVEQMDRWGWFVGVYTSRILPLTPCLFSSLNLAFLYQPKLMSFG